MASKFVVACVVCDKNVHKRSVGRHMKVCHNLESNRKGSVCCQEPSCSKSSFFYIEELRSHLETVHNLPIVHQVLEFSSREDFDRWKSNEEKALNFVFTLKSGARKSTDGLKTWYWYCNRSGSFHSRASQPPQRKMKTCRVGHHCTAGLILRQKENGFVADYHVTHYHNSLELPSVPSPNSDRDFVLESHNRAAQLASAIVVQGDVNNWSVLTTQDATDSYQVSRLAADESHACPLFCYECNCCVHSYSCTCADFDVKGNVCQHVHLVCINFPVKGKTERRAEISNDKSREESERSELLTILSVESNQSNDQCRVSQTAPSEESNQSIDQRKMECVATIKQTATELENAHLTQQDVNKLESLLKKMQSIISKYKNKQHISPILGLSKIRKQGIKKVEPHITIISIKEIMKPIESEIIKASPDEKSILDR